MTANGGIWKLYHGSMPIVNTRVLPAVVYGSYIMAVVTPVCTVGRHCMVYVTYILHTTGGAFDLYSSHSTNF